MKCSKCGKVDAVRGIFCDKCLIEKIREEAAREREEKKEELLKGSGMEGVYRTCGIAEEFLSVEFADFEAFASKEQQKPVRDALYRSKWRMLYVHGRPGRGKTHFACSFVREMIHKDILTAARRVKFIALSDILLKLRASFATKKDDSEKQILDEFCSYDLLVIDDIGRERQSDFTREVLFYIADYRKSWKKATIYITDKKIDIMRGVLYNEAVFSRIYHNPVYFTGPDRRVDAQPTIEVKK